MLAHCIATAPLHKLAKRIYETEGDLPDELLNGPPLMPGNFLFLQAFFNLTYERPSGDLVMPIPWSAIQRYAVEYLDLESEQLFRFHNVIRGVDSKYIETQNSKTVKAARKMKPPPSKRK